jgi:hypothetical protein
MVSRVCQGRLSYSVLDIERGAVMCHVQRQLQKHVHIEELLIHRVRT